MEKKKFVLVAGAIILAIVAAFADRGNKFGSPTSLFFKNGGNCVRLAVICDGNVYLFTGTGYNTQAVVVSGTGVNFALFATSSCARKVYFVP